MRKILPFLVALCLGLTPLFAAAQSPGAVPLEAASQDQNANQPYTEDQLDNLLAPIALYPDPLLAQVLIAATFPDQIDEATRWVRSYGQNGVDGQPWDVSVRAVAHYPTVLYMMDDNLDWTTALGQAYVYQSTDVMASVQRLRAMANQQGNLVTTPQQEVIVQSGYISIWPVSPIYIYVPIYDPSIIFFRRVYFGGIFTAFSFSPGLVIGVWLNLDCDWGRHRIYYTGWRGSGWIGRSRRHIRMNSIYVNPRLSNILVNRRVIDRPVNYQDLSRFRSIHRGVNFQNRIRGAQPPTRPSPGRVPNKIIDRNISPSQRLDQFRGHQSPTPTPPARQIPRQPAPPRQPQPQQQPGQRGNAPPVRQARPAPAQRAPAARPTPPSSAQPPGAFGSGDGAFNTRTASQRGRQSRQQMKQPPPAKPATRPAPQRQPRQAPKTQSRPQRPGRR